MMALKRNTKKPAKIVPLLEVQSSSDLTVRLEKISKQTGLSSTSLLQKWILQEETLIGVMQRNKKPMKEQAETRLDVAQQKTPAARKKRAKAIPSDSGKPNYRKELVKKATMLKKEGMTLQKIAQTFNEEKVATVSGTGKWYASSISLLLKSKI